MQQLHATAGIVRKIVFLALLGFLGLFLIGPVVAVLSVLLSFALIVLSFALIGFLLWLPFQVVFVSRGFDWPKVREQGGAVCRRACGIVRWGCCGLVPAGQIAWEKARGTARFLAAVCLETLSGALVGVLLGAVAAMRNDAPQVAIPVGAGVGALLGLLVGLSMAGRSRECAAPERAGE